MAWLFAVLLTAALTPPTVEQPLTPPGPLGGSPGAKTEVSIATSGDGDAVIWTDGRAYGSVWAARRAGDGRVLDATGIEIARNAEALDIVWTGRHYLIAYARRGDLGVYTVTLTPDGVVGRERKSFSSTADRISGCELATNGSTVLAAMLFGDSALLTVEGELVKRIPMPHVPVSVASAGGDYLVAMTTGLRSSATQLVRGDGSLGAFLDFPFVERAALASTGFDYVLVSGGKFLEVRRIAADNSRANPRMLLWQTNGEGDFAGAHDPQVSWDGSRYTVAFVEWPRDVTVIEFDDANLARRSQIRAGETAAWRGFSIDASPGRTAIAWIGFRDGQVYAANTRGGSVSQATMMSASAAGQYEPRVAQAADGSVFTLFTEGRGYPPDVVVRLARHGGDAITVGKGAALAIAIDGSTVWVLFYSSTTMVQRFTTGLVPIDREAWPVSLFAARAASITDLVAGGGRAAFVTHAVYNPVDYGVRVTVIEPDGAGGLRGSTTEVADVTSLDAAIVWDGSAFRVAWSAVRDGAYALDTMLIANDGRPIGAPLPVRHSGAREPMSIRLAAGPHGTAVAWQEGEELHVAAIDGTRARLVVLVRSLLAFAADARGYTLFFVAPNGAELHAVNLDRLLRPAGDSFLILRSESWRGVGAILYRGAPLVVYGRPSTDPAHGGVLRLFVRQQHERRRAAR